MANFGPKDGGTVRGSLDAMRQERPRLTQLWRIIFATAFCKIDKRTCQVVMAFNRLPIGVSLSSLGVRAATAKLASPLSEPPRFEWGARSRARAVNLPRALSPRSGYLRALATLT